ncbi:MAG: nucleotidyltransferase domain-containing protein [Cyanobacteria bacterium J06636_16]
MELTNPTLPIQLPDLTEFCQRWQVAELAVFGSILREDFNETSDVDFLVTFIPKAPWGLFDHARMQQELEAQLNRKVDLVSRRAIERSQNWIRRQDILSTAQVIYVRES